ncbi:polysaccharide deacetylase family protein [Alicyclobacillus mengziensis]|uniref:Polysaccharide deacetylase family protein n=1 Tax=Alicyclobacillus mengziensis TaxID=2931921 RepID=A0A9X7Z7A5_9BACL|nr:polysaccharide deacetylase family protein [Alicyclobacillus mengziensis]QSO47191.1 polysaccharide deacetylase family protein [Alicyclobacillus mengziensis]
MSVINPWLRISSILTTSVVLLVAGCNNTSSPASANGNSPTQSAQQTNSVQPAKSALPLNQTKANLTDITWTSNPKTYEITTTQAPNYSLSVPILEYHDADYVPGDIATLKPGQLDAEFAWLKQSHFHPVNLGQLYASFYYGYQLPSRPIVLTFDDGYESMDTKVLPLLKKYDFQATFFIVKGFTHTNRAHNNKTFPTLTVSELKDMMKSNLVDIEDHTEHHLDLSKLSVSHQKQEIQGDAAFLEQFTGHPIKYFCYPDGGYTSATVQVIKQGEFLLATTQHQGYANLTQGPLTLDRLTVLDSTTLSGFANLLAPSLSHQYTPEQLYESGAKAFSSHDYQAAIADETQAITQDTGNYAAYTIKGIALCYAGHYNEGMSAINEALQLQPSYGYGLFNKALGLELYGHYDEAIATYKTAIPLGNGQWWKAWAYYGIASIYGRRGDVQHVAQYLKQAEAISQSTKVAARTEKDFNPVRSSPVFQALLR